MKKKVLALAVIAVVLFACQKESRKNGDAAESVDEGSPVPVTLTVGSPGIEVKSTGAVGGLLPEENVWSGQKIYVYSFHSGVSDFAADDVFINGVEVTATSSSSTAALDLRQSPGSYLDGADVSGEPFYYQGADTYDFFAYYVDDAWTSTNPAVNKPVIKSEGVSIPIAINGAQDVMLAKTDKAADIASAGSMAVSVTPEKAYSAYSARRNVVPSLKFRHLLTRFTFEIKAGAASAYEVSIERLELTSKYMADLVVVAADEQDRKLVNIDEQTTSFVLQERNSEGALQDLGSTVFDGVYDPDNKEIKPIGESIMAMPGSSSYKLKLTTRHLVSNTPTQPFELTIDTGNPEKVFEAGKSYKITLVVYGPEKVVANAELEAWVDGGDVVVDPDEE